MHGIFLSYTSVENVVTGNVFLTVLYIVLSVIVIYAVCLVVYFVYEKIIIPLFKILENRIGLPGIDLEKQDDLINE